MARNDFSQRGAREGQKQEKGNQIMNKQNINKKPLRGFLSVCAIAALAGALLITTARVASADYGQGAVYGLNGHEFRGHPLHATSDAGDITGWHYDGNNVVIEGVQLNGFLPFVFYSTITVPSLYGHYTQTGIGAYMTWPFFVDTSAGFSQLQVAP
jgi:hypothetical protein